MTRLTPPQSLAYSRSAARVRAVGFDSLDNGGESRKAFSYAAFLRLVRPSMGGLGGEPQGSPVAVTGLSTRSVCPPRLTAWCAVQQPERRYTMAQSTQGASAPMLGRNTASNLNPFIGIHAEETLQACTLAVSDLGYILSVANSSGCTFDTGNLFRLFEVITRALRFEIETMNQGERA